MLFASRVLEANKISLKPQGFNITFFWKYLATGEVFSKENITLTLVSISRNRQKEREDSLIYESSLFCCSVGLGYCPTEFVHTNAMLVLNRNRYDYKFSDKNNNDYAKAADNFSMIILVYRNSVSIVDFTETVRKPEIICSVVCKTLYFIFCRIGASFVYDPQLERVRCGFWLDHFAGEIPC